MNKKNFDLTTVEGMQIAKGFISKVIFIPSLRYGEKTHWL